MPKKQPLWFRKNLTFLGQAIVGVSLAVLIGFSHSGTGLKSSLTQLPSLSIGGTPATAHQLVNNSTNLAATDASKLVQQGRELYQAGRLSEAATLWRQAGEAYQAQADGLNQAVVLSYLSLAYEQLGQWPQANAAIAQSLKLLQTDQGNNSASDRLPILAEALNAQGSLQLAQGQAQQALTTWQQAAATYAQAGDEAGQIGSLINVAQAQQALGLYLRARQTLTQVEQALQKQQDLQIKNTGLLSLGNILQLLGDLDESRRVLQQSLAIAQQLKSPQNLSDTLLSLGNTARTQQDTKAALTFYQQAAAISTSQTTQTQAQLNQLSLLLDTQQWSDAQALLPEIQSKIASLPANRKAVYAQINFAQNLARLKESPAKNTFSWQQIAEVAAIATQQAQRLEDRAAQAYALGNLGGIYEKTQQWSQAFDLTQQALVLAQAINAPDIAYRWQWQLGRLLKAQANPKGAIAAYSEAVHTLQSLRSDLVAINSEVQFSFRDSVEPVYRELVGLLLEADGTEPSPDRLEQARKVIESLQVAELDNFFRSACLQAKSVEIDAIDGKAAVIYPIILGNRLEVILSTPQQPLRHYTVSLTKQEVESTLGSLRVSLLKRLTQGFLPLSQQVYNWLIRPLEADLAKSEIKTLVFVLDGSLRNIPMAALHDGKQYLIEKYAIALAPGLELLESQPLAREEVKVLKAGLSQASQGFPALPYVETEINQIQSEVPGEVLLNQKFTKTNLQNAIDAIPFPVVHLATHGQFSSKSEETFILTWDGRLNVNELNNLLQTANLRRHRPVELLVLSGCETAKGDNRAALGIAGVAVRAGARSTLATLWLVDDKATAALMSQFYKELANSKLTKAEALRRAQQSLLQDTKYKKHPYYWAPYILLGNWL